MNFKKWVNNIQTSAYNGARTAVGYASLLQYNWLKSPLLQFTGKEWELEKETEVNSEFVSIKSLRIILDFLSAV